MNSTPKPLKRNPSLQPLSREHHDGLMLCFKIRQAIAAGADPEKITTFIHWFSREHLEPHFAAEEKYLLPLLAADDHLSARTLEEHSVLRSYFKRPLLTTEELSHFAALLDDHIRFEERILFQALQSSVSEEELLKALSHEKFEEACVNWQDERWLERN